MLSRNLQVPPLGFESLRTRHNNLVSSDSRASTPRNPPVSIMTSKAAREGGFVAKPKLLGLNPAQNIDEQFVVVLIGGLPFFTF
jgi:hypothetical protein